MLISMLTTPPCGFLSCLEFQVLLLAFKTLHDPLPQWNPDPPTLFQVFLKLLTHGPTHQRFYLKRMVLQCPGPPSFITPSLSLTAPLLLPANVLQRLLSFSSAVCERRYIINFSPLSPYMSLALTDSCFQPLSLYTRYKATASTRSTKAGEC